MGWGWHQDNEPWHWSQTVIQYYIYHDMTYKHIWNALGEIYSCEQHIEKDVSPELEHNYVQ